MTQITFKGNPVHTNGKLPQVGQKAPNFVLVDKELKDRTLADFSGKKIIISTVPSLDTSVCATSAKKFNKALANKKNVVMLVVSCDLPFAQGRFCEAEKVDHITTLSMMRSKDFAKDYGVLMEDGPLKGLCARSIIILDEQHKVIYTQIVPEITQEPDYEKALKSVDSLSQHGHGHHGCCSC